MVTKKNKKYKLFKPEPGAASPPCAFFFSGKGCKNGDQCKFSHALPDKSTTVSVEEEDFSSDIVSSESEDEASVEPVRTARTGHVDPAVGSCDDDLFASPGERPKMVQTPSKTTPISESNKKKKRKKNSDANNTLFNNPKQPKVASPPVTPVETPRKKAKIESSSFRSLSLPISSFSCYEEGDKKSTSPNKSAVKPKQKNKTTIPIPKSTPEGIKWQKACLQTRAHHRYQSSFNFKKFKEMDKENGCTSLGNWVKARPFGPWCAKNPHAIAIDCEMCETKDPVTGAKDHKALCRLSVVSAVNPDDVLIDTLVKPEWPVSDYRSRINGIKKEHLESVQFTLAHAQAFMTALCSEETIIIGHAVHNDLAALKMEHHCNVDSACLFSIKDEPEATCSLKDLAMAVLEREMPDTHDSVNDARVAFLCLEKGYVLKNGAVEPIERTFDRRRRVGDGIRDGSYLASLFVHRIPKVCKSTHIQKMLIDHSSIAPKKVDDIEFGSSTGKTTVEFSSAAHANLAFKSLKEKAQPDKTGRMQKRVYMRNGDYLYIRQMVKFSKEVK